MVSSTRALSSEGEVDWHRREIFDSTAVFAAQSLSAAMQSNLTNPSQRWFDLRFRNSDLNTETEVKDWLETSTDLMYQALEDTNFSVEISEAYTDLVGYGTAVVTEEVDERVSWCFRPTRCVMLCLSRITARTFMPYIVVCVDALCRF